MPQSGKGRKREVNGGNGQERRPVSKGRKKGGNKVEPVDGKKLGRVKTRNKKRKGPHDEGNGSGKSLSLKKDERSPRMKPDPKPPRGGKRQRKATGEGKGGTGARNKHRPTGPQGNLRRRKAPASKVPGGRRELREGGGDNDPTSPSHGKEIRGTQLISKEREENRVAMKRRSGKKQSKEGGTS